MPQAKPFRHAAALFVSVFLLAGSLRADHYPRQTSVDVRNYVFQLELKDDTDRIAGKTEIDALFKDSGVRELALDLVGRSPDGKTGMTVTEVRSDGKSLAFTHEHNRLRIDLGSPSQAGESRRITLVYAGIPADGLIIGPNKLGERVFFGDNFPDRCRYWLPTIDHPYDKSACEFDVIAPEAYQVVAPGALVETSSLPNGRRLTRYRESVPISTYCMVIGAARFAVETVGKVGNVPVQSWVYALERDAGFSDYRIALKPMELFSRRIGPFPYEKLANVQSRTRYGGMENSSAIFYSERSVTGEGRTERLFAHEIAHQWFGDSVTESDWDHTWLSEGFATYLTHVYVEATYGRQAMAEGLRGDRVRVIRYFEDHPDSAIVTPADEKLDNILTTNSYQKGSWFLHMLRRLVGDEAFWKGISIYYGRYRNGNALTEDFRHVMEEVSGKPLEEFFRQWVYTPGQPVIEGDWTYGGGLLTVEIRQTQTTGTVYHTALDLGIVSEPGEAPAIETVELDRRAQTFAFRRDRAPADVVLDPNVRLLMQSKGLVKK